MDIEILVKALQLIAADRFGTGMNSGLKAYEIADKALKEARIK